MTRAIGEVGPQTECDACFWAAWHAECSLTPDATLAQIDARADDARANGQHPCTNHK